MESVDDLGACPRCKTTKYRNPGLKLLVNVCGHSLCEQCVDVLFVRGSGACPECGATLRRQNFRLQYFEDASVQREVDIRKRVLRDVGRRQDDFSSLDEYNDHLETIEELVHNLTNNVQVEETKARVENMKRKMKSEMGKKTARPSAEEQMMEEMLEAEGVEAEKRRAEYLRELREKKRNRNDEHQHLLEELIHSNLPANHVLAKFKSRKQRREEVEQPGGGGGAPPAVTQPTFLSQTQFAGDMVLPDDDSKPYSYTQFDLDMCGPEAPPWDSLDTYLGCVTVRTPAERAGGYTPKYECQRALQAAFSGLALYKS